MSVLAEAPPRESLSRPRRTWPEGWPLTLLVVGYPLWWALGVQESMLPALAVPMAASLLRRGSVRLPRGFWLWVLFLVWMAIGVLVLGVHAPGAVDDSSGGRVMTWAFRLVWYVSATVAMLYVGNASRSELSDQRVMRPVKRSRKCALLISRIGFAKFTMTAIPSQAIRVSLRSGMDLSVTARSAVPARTKSTALTFLSQSNSTAVPGWDFSNALPRS